MKSTHVDRLNARLPPLHSLRSTVKHIPADKAITKRVFVLLWIFDSTSEPSNGRYFTRFTPRNGRSFADPIYHARYEYVNEPTFPRVVSAESTNFYARLLCNSATLPYHGIPSAESSSRFARACSRFIYLYILYYIFLYILYLVFACCMHFHIFKLSTNV